MVMGWICKNGIRPVRATHISPGQRPGDRDTLKLAALQGQGMPGFPLPLQGGWLSGGFLPRAARSTACPGLKYHALTGRFLYKNYCHWGNFYLLLNVSINVLK